MTGESTAPEQSETASVAPLRYPDFLGIGVQKAGTSWVHENLRLHPRLWLPRIKELHYFNHLYIEHHRKWTEQHRIKHATKLIRDTVARDGALDLALIKHIAAIGAGPVDDRWYGEVFSAAPAARLCGEITPEYSLLPDQGISHILRLSPAVRVILLFRDPIERNWSHIRMIARGGGGTSDSDLRRIAEYSDVLARADYPAILKRWSERIAPERLLIGFADEIRAKPFQVLERICQFLEVDYREKCFRRAHDTIHAGVAMQMPDSLYEAMRESLRSTYAEMEQLFPDPCRSWTQRHYG